VRCACLILALSTAMVGLVAALIVGVAFGAIAVGLALIGKNKVHEACRPHLRQTVDSVPARPAVHSRRGCLSAGCSVGGRAPR
jgi:hypothetical protein